MAAQHKDLMGGAKIPARGVNIAAGLPGAPLPRLKPLP